MRKRKSAETLMVGLSTQRRTTTQNQPPTPKPLKKQLSRSRQPPVPVVIHDLDEWEIRRAGVSFDPYMAYVQTGDHLIEWKDEDHEFLELLERPFRKSFGLSEVEASGQIPQSQKIADGEGKVDSISIASHPASRVADYYDSGNGPFNHNGVIFSSEVVSPGNRTIYGACNFPGTNTPNEDVVVVDASDDDHFTEQSIKLGRIQHVLVASMRQNTCDTLLQKVLRSMLLVQKFTNGLKQLLGIMGHLVWILLISVLQTWIMCSDCAEMNIFFPVLVSTVGRLDLGDTYFNGVSFPRDTDLASQPTVRDNDTERDSSTYDQSGSSTNPRAKSAVASREYKGPEEETDMWEDNANLELHSDPMNDDEAAFHQGRYTDFKSTDGVPEFRLHQKFDSKNDFKNAVKTYSILSGRPVSMYTNEGDCLRATCNGGCKWFVYPKKINHDVCCILKQGGEIIDHGSPYYSKEDMVRLYENVLYPIDHMDRWPVTKNVELQPSLDRNAWGNHKKKKTDEDTRFYDDGTVRAKRPLTMHCSRCGAGNHNVRRCTDPVVDNDSAAQEGRRNGTCRNIRSNGTATRPTTATIPIGGAEMGGSSVQPPKQVCMYKEKGTHDKNKTVVCVCSAPTGNPDMCGDPNHSEQEGADLVNTTKQPPEIGRTAAPNVEEQSRTMPVCKPFSSLWLRDLSTSLQVHYQSIYVIVQEESWANHSGCILL
ncbi:OLC1v1036348C1 [Oldenlandia corymbosa var. corymbosa]|uniref:OLC1v1036348C1 n=1 Tax=Oldenlandia corymbosa var. corymbosa TaxID=529605 RepID=A0AAV1CVX9_OLDCO|nr:OLC1v1036348C1 [Oldenlandia corymbosa var. corymbosa]